MTNDLEFAQVQQQVLEGLKTGNEALKRIHEVMTIDEVERIMDETREGVDKQKVKKCCPLVGLLLIRTVIFLGN